MIKGLGGIRILLNSSGHIDILSENIVFFSPKKVLFMKRMALNMLTKLERQREGGLVTGYEDHEALLTKTPLSREPGEEAKIIFHFFAVFLSFQILF